MVRAVAEELRPAWAGRKVVDMSYGRSVVMDAPYSEVVSKVREALSEQGFGVLTEIDVKKTLKSKLDLDMEEYVILGACNPNLAHQALGVQRQLGLLLPCNVVVRTDGAKTIVEALDPQVMVALTEDDALKPVADEAARRLEAALGSLSG